MTVTLTAKSKCCEILGKCTPEIPNLTAPFMHPLPRIHPEKGCFENCQGDRPVPALDTNMRLQTTKPSPTPKHPLDPKQSPGALYLWIANLENMHNMHQKSSRGVRIQDPGIRSNPMYEARLDEALRMDTWVGQRKSCRIWPGLPGCLRRANA